MICLKTLVSATFAFNALSIIGVASAAATAANISSAATSDPLVNLGYSIYQGTRLANGQNQWLCIRYGAPPTYNNRFRKPQPPASTFQVIQSAKSFGHVCYGQGGNNGNDPNMYGEDCLFMNIRGPSSFTGLSRLPVFFWLSGGAYIRKANPNYNGTGLVGWTKNNMIFVSINYRVGPFGFLASEGFGGDPNRVVVVGESAGAGSIAMHLITRPDIRKNLFAGLVGLSPFFPTQFFPSNLQWQFNTFASNSGCGNVLDQLTCLRQQQGATLQRANVNMAFPGRPGPALTTWAPTIDGVLVPDIPFKLFTEHNFRAVPSIWGVDTDEGTLFAPNASAIFERRLSNSPLLSGAPYFPAGAESYADVTFNCPGLALSTLMAGVAPTWNYRYNVPTIQGITDNTGVYHMAELPLLFGIGNSPLPDPGSYARLIQPVLQTYYTNFVRFLNPNVGFSPSIFWPQWTVQLPASRLVFQVNNMITEPLTSSGVQFTRCSVWSQTQLQQ